ncbi:lysophospholipid acyltransferase 2 [Myotis lucifugus]|uniref:lysophospholipid acyltransferase 2 n=1 Tax=Myotis lucifugus TaxID=59463 RepID=UPI000CCC82A8|nr:lysophospholipid acyltransferase 2 [Myotis lucifugus]
MIFGEERTLSGSFAALPAFTPRPCPCRVGTAGGPIPLSSPPGTALSRVSVVKWETSRHMVNFVVCQLFALLAAVWFRTYLHSSKTSSFIRHVVATLLGLYLAVFCFGWYALHFLVQSGVSYCIMIIIGMEHMHKYCFVFALGYLIVCQITRVYIFDYGQYSADFSGPMMIMTQKITSLAYEIHDGMFRKDEDLTPSQRDLAVRRMPSLLEYLSYNCNFMGILAGPLCSYKDYITFIEGRSYHVPRSGEDGRKAPPCGGAEPSPNVRAGGSTSFKMFLDNWNIQTALWLKRVCYERTTWSPTVQTFVLSAIWHGVYPGYYLTFLTGVLMTLAARAMRSNFRHYFLKSPQLKLLYDVVTWGATQVAVSYTVVPFVLLSVKPSFAFYSSWSYCLHIAGLLVLLFLPVKKTQRGQDPHEHRRLSRSKKSDENSWGQNSFPTTTNNVCNQGPAGAARHPSGTE